MDIRYIYAATRAGFALVYEDGEQRIKYTATHGTTWHFPACAIDRAGIAPAEIALGMSNEFDAEQYTIDCYSMNCHGETLEDDIADAREIDEAIYKLYREWKEQEEQNTQDDAEEHAPALGDNDYAIIEDALSDYADALERAENLIMRFDCADHTASDAVREVFHKVNNIIGY